jgi:hypothetical protein
MLEFKGTSEQQWLDTPAHHVRDIYKRLIEYKKKHPDFQCPFVTRKK